MKKVLIIGGTSLLGKQLILDLSNICHLSATFHNDKTSFPGNVTSLYLDVINKTNVKKIISLTDWDFILHTASLGDVDYCEKHQIQAVKVNIQGTKNIAKTLNPKSRLIYFSTNAIYDGKDGHYDEKSHANPLNFYGKTKFEGEAIVQKLAANYMILRLNTMYGWNNPKQRSNPSMWIINNLREKKSIKVVNDIYNTHLWVGFVSILIKKLLTKKINREIINIGGSDCLNRYQFAQLISKVFKLDSKLIQPVKSSNFSYLAARPLNTCFNTNKMEKLFKVKAIPTHEGLLMMRSQKKFLSNE